MVRQLIIAFAVSFFLSLAFWAVFGVFALAPFFMVSSLCAILGASIGILAKNKVWITIIATAAIRIAAYALATSSIGHMA
jgi:hypothetical protein